ncbi:MAG: hypothetical protein DRJ15_14720 [Bacteroidetes bacterium]|nr:MAG: hypothetical protein DRJ15_14720 [Bacteroidota bacterium]
MLTRDVEHQILELVQKRPCTIQEVAQTLGRNWRTADKYVERIAQESGLIATRTFRKGSRGALKVVYWNALDKQTGSAYQQRLLNRILIGRQKEDFSSFDIYQFVPEETREALVLDDESKADPCEMLRRAGEQLLSLSGNLSWLDLYPKAWDCIEELARRHVSIKVLTRVDVTSAEKTERLLAINERVGWDAIAIRHAEHPLRAIIIDDRLVSIKEVLSPSLSPYKELSHKMIIFYRISDHDWVVWMQKVFWHLWEQSIDAQMRIDALKALTKTN